MDPDGSRRRSALSKVTDIVEEIAAAAREQASGIEQVTHSVAEMDKVIQQNAASAEESSSAASELSGQAEELAAMVAGFQLEANQTTSLPIAMPATQLPPKGAAVGHGRLARFAAPASTVGGSGEVRRRSNGTEATGLKDF